MTSFYPPLPTAFGVNLRDHRRPISFKEFLPFLFIYILLAGGALLSFCACVYLLYAERIWIGTGIAFFANAAYCSGWIVAYYAAPNRERKEEAVVAVDLLNSRLASQTKECIKPPNSWFVSSGLFIRGGEVLPYGLFTHVECLDGNHITLWSQILNGKKNKYNTITMHLFKFGILINFLNVIYLYNINNSYIASFSALTLSFLLWAMCGLDMMLQRLKIARQVYDSNGNMLVFTIAFNANSSSAKNLLSYLQAKILTSSKQ